MPKELQAWKLYGKAKLLWIGAWDLAWRDLGTHWFPVGYSHLNLCATF